MRPAASSRRRALAGRNPRANPTAPFPRTAAGKLSDRHGCFTARAEGLAVVSASTLNLVGHAPRRGRTTFYTFGDNSLADDMSMNPSRDEFAALLDETL